MSQINSFIAREDFYIAKQTFEAANYRMDQIRLVTSSIRMEQPLVAAQNMYTFPVLVNIQNQAQPFPTEIRLQQQDSLCVTQIGVFLALATSTTDSTFKLETYPNPAVFTNAVQLNTIYQNGRVFLTVDNDIYLKQWDMMRHYCVNQTQQTAPPGAGSPIDQLDGTSDGYYPMTPMIILTGAQDIQLTLQMPLQAPTAVDAFSRIVIIMRGFLAQMSTVIK
jgi:hypothetical protein